MCTGSADRLAGPRCAALLEHLACRSRYGTIKPAVSSGHLLPILRHHPCHGRSRIADKCIAYYNLLYENAYDPH